MREVATINTNILVVDKPSGMTSHDVVNLVRRVTSVRRVGHGGTLDPMASGVLVIGIGRDGTKRLHTELQADKEYVATVRLDGVSDTDDAEGKIGVVKVTKIPTVKQVREVLAGFVGPIDQLPPSYSAIKIGGQPAYKLARMGKRVNLGHRQVVIHSIELIDFTWPRLVIKVACGPGVYIRSLARDAGILLKTGGYLIELRRTKSGLFGVDQAWPISRLVDLKLSGQA